MAQGVLKPEELPPQPIALGELDQFFAHLASMSPAQWTETVMEFIRLQMSDEAAHQAAWGSVLGLTQKAVDGGDEVLASAVRAVTRLAQAAVHAAFPDVDAPSPRYEAARRAAGDMVIAAAFAVLLRRQLPDEASKILYEPFRPLFSDGPTPA